MPTDPHVWAVIMAGGSGTRFWPLSRSSQPKQLSNLLGDATMIQATVARLQPFVEPERILVITTALIAEQTRAQLPMLPSENIVAEPMGRDTAPCVCLAAEIVHHRDPEGVMVLLPADQVIAPVDRFQRTLAAGVAVARSGGLVLYGIQPRWAATGYGYIKLGAEADPVDDIPVSLVERFVEKPDAETAAAYLAEGCYRWNSGIFTWRVDVVREELGRHCAWLTDALGPVGAAFGTPAFDEQLGVVYPTLDKISIDYALMEQAETIKAVTCDFDWDDVGSWDALYNHIDLDAEGVRTRGDVIQIDCKDSLFLQQGGPLIAALGLEGMTVVSTGDAILVVPKGDSQGVKQLVDLLKEQRPDLLA